MSLRNSPNRQPRRKKRKKKAISSHISAPYKDIGIHKSLLACSVTELKEIALSVNVGRTGNKNQLITRIQPILDEKIKKHRKAVKARLAPLTAMPNKKFLLLAKSHSVPIEPKTFQAVRRKTVSSETLFKLASKEHNDLMDKFEMNYNAYRGFIDFCIDVKDGVINLGAALVNDNEEINEMDQLNQLNHFNEIENKQREQLMNDSSNQLNIGQLNIGQFEQAQQRLQQPPAAPVAPAPIQQPQPPIQQPQPPPPIHRVVQLIASLADVDKGDACWISLMRVACTALFEVEATEYRAWVKNKDARQALVGPTRVIEFNKYINIKEKEILNEVLKILVPPGYLTLSKEEPPASALLVQSEPPIEIENEEKLNEMAESEKKVRKQRGGHPKFWIKFNNYGQVFMDKDESGRQTMLDVRNKYTLNVTNSLLINYGQEAVDTAVDCGLIDAYIPPVENNENDGQMDLMAELGII